jgi:hypothetical protein
MKREKADMTFKTFMRTMEHVMYYDKLGTQHELSFTGVGEALLHPEFISMLAYARKRFEGLILFATNGILLTEIIAEQLAHLGVKVYVSLHRPELAGGAVELCRRYGILGDVNAGFATAAMNWAGDVDWYVSAPEQRCAYLHQGWAAVLQDGTVNACCWDAEGRNAIGHVDDVLGSLKTEIKPLCSECNLIKPPQEITT